MQTKPEQKLPPAGFDPVAFINEPRWRDMSLGLGRIEALMRELGDPHLKVPCVHVAGTNGKGSTCAFLASILRESGYRTGLFTSPYIERFEERIQVDGQMIAQEALACVVWRVKAAAEEVERSIGEHPTEFELMFACAALWFAEQRCDIAVIECGLGGRLDATNCVIPMLSVITPIGLDHTDILGSTIAAIAKEKSGIVKPGIPVLTAPQPQEALEAISEACKRQGSALRVLQASDVRPFGTDTPSMTQRFEFDGEVYETSLLGSYQPMNASLAISAAELLRAEGLSCIDGRSVHAGISAARWPGRFEVVAMDGAPLIVIDGAHNADGAMSLAGSLGELLEHASKSWDDVVAVCGVLADKDYESIVSPFKGHIHRWVTYAPDNPRALASDDLAAAIDADGTIVECAANAKAAADRAVEMAGPEGVVAAFGSLYGISSVRCGLQNVSAASEA